MSGLRAALLALLTVTALAMAACGASANVTDASARVCSSDIASAGDGTEAGQRVLVALRFDDAVTCDADAAGDFSVRLNGEALDPDVMSLGASQDGSDALVLSIAPSDKAIAGTAKKPFAFYEGQIEVASARDDGALPHVRSADGSSAVLVEPVSGIVPTGIAIQPGQVAAGDEAAGVPASCTFTVTHGPVLRCCAWLDLGSGPVCFIHNHQFRMETPESCAGQWADAVNAANLGLVATAAGAEVTIVAEAPSDGQALAPSVYEGIGAHV